MIPALALFALTYVLMLRLPQERPWEIGRAHV